MFGDWGVRLWAVHVDGWNALRTSKLHKLDKYLLTNTPLSRDSALGRLTPPVQHAASNSQKLIREFESTSAHKGSFSYCSWDQGIHSRNEHSGRTITLVIYLESGFGRGHDFAFNIHRTSKEVDLICIGLWSMIRDSWKQVEVLRYVLQD